MKDLKVTPSRIEKTLVCFFYGTLSYENGDKEGKICIVNSNAGASKNIVKVSKEDFLLLKEGKNGAPDLVSLPAYYIETCEFSTCPRR